MHETGSDVNTSGRLGLQANGRPKAQAMRIAYVAPDGSAFDTPEECLEYEASESQEYWDRQNALNLAQELTLINADG